MHVSGNWTHFSQQLEGLTGVNALSSLWVGAVIEQAKVHTYGSQETSTLPFTGRAKGCAQYHRPTQGLISIKCNRRLSYVCQRVSLTASPVPNPRTYMFLWEAGRLRHAQAVRACRHAGLQLAAPSTAAQLEEVGVAVGQSHVTAWLAGKYVRGAWSAGVYPGLAGAASRCVAMIPTRDPTVGFGGVLDSRGCRRRQ